MVNQVIVKGSMPAGDVLWAFNAYLEKNASASAAFPHCLKVAYDEDWCEEEHLLEYYVENAGEGEPGFDVAKVAAAPFLEWLTTADSASDESG